MMSFRAQKICRTLLFAIFAAAPMALAETITADGVVAEALAYSRALRMSSEDVQMAEAREREAASAARPVLSLDARAAWYTGLEDAALGPAIVIPGIEERYAAGVNAAQPLYAGGRIRRTREAAEQSHRAAKFLREAAQARVELAARQLYWEWSKASGTVAALEKSIRRMEAHGADLQKWREAGVATDAARLSAEVRTDQTRLRLQQAQGAEKKIRARIEWITGRPLKSGDMPQPPMESLDRTPKEEIVLHPRPESLAARLQERAAQAAISAERSGRRPSLNLAARYEWANPNALFFPPESEWNDDASVALLVSWNLWDGGRTAARVRGAQAGAMRARLAAEQSEEDAKLEVREAQIDYDTALRRLSVAERALKSAETNRADAAAQWKNGMARHAEYLDAESDVAVADCEVNAAAADVWTARAALRHATAEPASAKEVR